MHYRLELQAESACHELRHVRQSVWQLHLHIHFRQCHYGLSMVTMVSMGGDLQPGCLADRLLTGLGQSQINP